MDWRSYRVKKFKTEIVFVAVKLPALLARTDLEQRKLDLLAEHLQKFLRYVFLKIHPCFHLPFYFMRLTARTKLFIKNLFNPIKSKAAWS